ncbi:hypothetical protein BDW72DRAFT_205016 [Aspergillus terricola var. indicus]
MTILFSTGPESYSCVTRVKDNNQEQDLYLGIPAFLSSCLLLSRVLASFMIGVTLSCAEEGLPTATLLRDLEPAPSATSHEGARVNAYPPENQPVPSFHNSIAGQRSRNRSPTSNFASLSGCEKVGAIVLVTIAIPVMVVGVLVGGVFVIGGVKLLVVFTKVALATFFDVVEWLTGWNLRPFWLNFMVD